MFIILLKNFVYSEDWDSFSYDTRKDSRPKVDLSLPSHAPEIYKRARKMDLLGDDKPRAHISGSYISWLGIQLHPSCIKYAKDAGIKDVEKKFERWVKSALKDVVDGCYVEYPEIYPYIQEWVTQARRAVITCTNKNPKMAKFAAVNCTHKLGVMNTLDRHEKFGLTHSGLLWDSQHDMYRSVIVFPLRTLKRGLLMPPSSFLSLNTNETFIHELFHSTSANNRSDHNTIQKYLENDNNMCKKNILDDRVEVFTNLCAGSYRKNYIPKHLQTKVYQKKIEDRLYNRITKCGMEKGCENTFTSIMSNPFRRMYERSRPLSKDKVIKLCSRIYFNSLKKKVQNFNKSSVELTDELNKSLSGLKMKPIVTCPIVGPF